MSAIPHAAGGVDEFGDGPTDAAGERDASLSSPPAYDAAAGDDWGSVLAVACLLVALIVGVLVLGGG